MLPHIPRYPTSGALLKVSKRFSYLDDHLGLEYVRRFHVRLNAHYLYPYKTEFLELDLASHRTCGTISYNPIPLFKAEQDTIGSEAILFRTSSTLATSSNAHLFPPRRQLSISAQLTPPRLSDSSSHVFCRLPSSTPCGLLSFIMRRQVQSAIAPPGLSHIRIMQQVSSSIYATATTEEVTLTLRFPHKHTTAWMPYMQCIT